MDSITELTPEIQIDTPTVWYGCYDGGWGNDITSLSYSHPAKMSRGLAIKIYQYALERGWLKPGMVVVDPFAGIGGTCLDALANGLSWVGVELESRFCDLGQGCDCTGISKADWIRFYGRLEKANYKDGRHWCPECLAEAKQVTESLQMSFFEPEPSAAYARNSGIVPETKPHRYKGNLDLFRKYAKPGTFAVLLNGDSRQLRRVIGQAAADGLLSSPPYATDTVNSRNGIDKSKFKRAYGHNSQALTMNGYGDSEGQLNSMPTGDLDGVISSPPFPDGGAGDGRPNGGMKTEPAKKGNYLGGLTNYGTTAGQLANLKGSDLDALLSSPPFAGNTGGRGEASRNGIDAALFDRHSGGMKRGTGDNPGNLDHLPMRGFEESVGGLVTSPPFEKGSEGVMRASKFKDPAAFARTQMNKGHGCSFEAKMKAMEADNDRAHYGQTAGQLGIEQGQTFWQAARDIVAESYLALKPGSFSFWVVKRFVRDGAIVDFTGQWRQLCEACGFEFVEHIQASLVQSESEQGGLNGDVVKSKKKRASFFRRLHEKRFPHLAIDFEDVLVMRKPEST